MRDISNPRLLWLKAGLFAILAGLGSVWCVFSPHQSERAAALAVAVWASCRAYYFTFHVLGNYLPHPRPSRGLLNRLHHAAARPSVDGKRTRRRPSPTVTQFTPGE